MQNHTITLVVNGRITEIRKEISMTYNDFTGCLEKEIMAEDNKKALVQMMIWIETLAVAINKPGKYKMTWRDQFGDSVSSDDLDNYLGYTLKALVTSGRHRFYLFQANK